MRSWVTLLFAVSLLHSCETQGTRVTPVFVQTGDDLLLNVDDVPGDYLVVDWKFNKTVDLVRFALSGEPNVFPDFTERIEFLVKNLSVKLKNLQKADSGVYTAQVITRTANKQLAEYKVTVQDPVSPVKLSVVSLVSVVSRSSASCNLTVTCSTQDSHISSTFTCVNRTCSQEGGEQAEVTTSGASLQVYLLNSSIICHHSNQVNGRKDFKMIEHVCPQYADRKHSPPPLPVLVISMSVTILILVNGVLVIVFHYRGKIVIYPKPVPPPVLVIIICCMILIPIIGVVVVIVFLYRRKKRGNWTRETPVFVQTGDDLLLNVDDVPKDYDHVDWKFNQTVNLVRFASGREPNVSPDFTGRIEFIGKEFSVKLKNLQKADSGVYTARVSTPDGDQQLAEYTVTVQDRKPVPVHVVIICVTILIPVIGGLVILFLYCRKKRGNCKRVSMENTVYETPMAATAHQHQSPTDDASGLCTYSLVGPRTGSLEPSETRGPALPESLYAQVDKPGRSSNN